MNVIVCVPVRQTSESRWPSTGETAGREPSADCKYTNHSLFFILLLYTRVMMNAVDSVATLHF